jgi:hypothetical protein
VKAMYETPRLAIYGSVASLTMGKYGSDVDGESGMIGNRSDSDNTMGNGGSNDGGM